MTSTEQIRHYFHYHRGLVFQIEDLHSRAFKEINYDSFRKFISRLAKEGEITNLGFGLYFNGPIDDDLKDQCVIDYFLDNRNGYYSGHSFLYELGVIEESRNPIEIKCNVNRGMTVGCVKAIPFGHGVGRRPGMFEFYCLCELFSMMNDLDDDIFEKCASFMKNFGLEIKVAFMEHGLPIFGSEANFPRYTYLKVANFLKPFNLYNEVIEWYENIEERKTY